MNVGRSLLLRGDSVPRAIAARSVASNEMCGRWHAVLMASIALLAGHGIGCTEADKVKTFSVRGEVFVDGKPAEQVRLVFHPAVGEAHLNKLAPRATTGKDGGYAVKTYWEGDGVPLGEYAVTAMWRGPLPVDAGSEDFNVAAYEDRPDVLGGKYSMPEKSGLKVKVEGPGVIPRFDLRTK